MKNFTIYIEYDNEAKVYVGYVPGISGAHSFSETIDGLKANLVEALSLCLSEMDDEDIALLPTFAGIAQIEVST